MPTLLDASGCSASWWAEPTLRGLRFVAGMGGQWVADEAELTGTADFEFALPVNGIFQLLGGHPFHFLKQFAQAAIVVGFFDVIGGDVWQGGVGVDLDLDDIVRVGRDGVSAAVTGETAHFIGLWYLEMAHFST